MNRKLLWAVIASGCAAGCARYSSQTSYDRRWSDFNARASSGRASRMRATTGIDWSTCK